MKRWWRPGLLLQALLVFLPITLVLRFAFPGEAVALFVTSCLAIVPLAGLMGRATEALANRVGAGLGSLLNASFGNAAELIIALVAIAGGKIEIVKASLTGSIIGNILFILGLSMLLGGARRESQSFNPTTASAGSLLLLLSVLGLAVPTLFGTLGGESDRGREVTDLLSVVLSAVLVLLYLLSLWFSQRTHRHLHDDEAGREGGGPDWKPAKAILVLVVCAALIGVVSEVLVGAVEDTIHSVGFTETFVGVVILAMVGNAAEHSTAVVMAIKNRMSMAFQIAVQSSLQIALFIAPICVFVGLALGQPMDLVFTNLDLLALGASVAVVYVASHDGQSNWLEGAALLAVYAILAVAFFFVP